MADFSGDNPLIYRQPQTTEPSELIQLNGKSLVFLVLFFNAVVASLMLSFFFVTGPNFVGSVAYGDYVFFFFTEIALEHMNSGKVC